jgi:hypothetical protein
MTFLLWMPQGDIMWQFGWCETCWCDINVLACAYMRSSERLKSSGDAVRLLEKIQHTRTLCLYCVPQYVWLRKIHTQMNAMLRFDRFLIHCHTLHLSHAAFVTRYICHTLHWSHATLVTCYIGHTLHWSHATFKKYESISRNVPECIQAH